MEEAKYFTLPLNKLYLDPNNYRFIHDPDYKEIPGQELTLPDHQKRAFRLLTGPRAQEIQDLIDSFKSNGFLQIDQIQVRALTEEKNGDYIVIEGNRRVAALKYLQDRHAVEGLDLGKLDRQIFTAVPVVIHQARDEEQHLVVMALKHISGNKKWGEWNQAKVLDKLVYGLEIDEVEVCNKIGITKHELRRTLRAFYFTIQYKKSDYGDQFIPAMFPIFRDAVASAPLKRWLEWDDWEYSADSEVNTEFFFSLLSRVPRDDDEGFANDYLDPVITKRDEVRKFISILDDPRAMNKLKTTRNLDKAVSTSALLFNTLLENTLAGIGQELDTLEKLNVTGGYFSDLERLSGRLQAIIHRNKAIRQEVVDMNEPFYDVLDAHFKQIQIKSYKCFNNFELERTARINLLAGDNNTGKTTLLEAIYLLTLQNDFTGLLEVVRRRGKVASQAVDPEWFLEQVQKEIEIGGTFDGKPGSIRIQRLKEDNREIDTAFYQGSVEITSEFERKRQESLTRLFKGEARQTSAEGNKVLCRAIFSSPFFLNEPHRYTEYFFKTSRAKVTEKIIGFIKETMIPSIKNIEIRDEFLRFMVDDSRWNEKMDLTQYGEGVQRVFFISLLFASARNGVVLIDEFENAIHTDLLPGFTGFIEKLAGEFNTQVFLTSHSKECIDALVRNIENPKDLMVTALVETKQGILARQYGGYKYRRLLDAGNVDVRRSR